MKVILHDDQLGGDTVALDTLARPVEVDPETSKRFITVRQAPEMYHQAWKKYTVLSEVGEGGMAKVFMGRDKDLKRTVAIKSLYGPAAENERAMYRFFEEAQITAQLQHPNIIPLYELGVNEEGRVFFSMKLVEGHTLEEIVLQIKRGNRHFAAKYDMLTLIDVFLDVLNALNYAHAAGVLHRDLKPANIMIGSFGEVYVMDWGLAKVLGRDGGVGSITDADPDGVSTARSDGSLALTQDGAVIGTPSFMSPEQAQGDLQTVDFRSDIFALGAILYFILTYTPPYPGRDISKVFERIRAADIDPIMVRHPDTEADEYLSTICMKALQLRQDDRYQTAGEFAEAIRQWKFDEFRYRRLKDKVIRAIYQAETKISQDLPEQALKLLLEAGSKIEDIPRFAAERERIAELTGIAADATNIKEIKKELEAKWAATMKITEEAYAGLAEGLWNNVSGALHHRNQLLNALKDLHLDRQIPADLGPLKEAIDPEILITGIFEALILLAGMEAMIGRRIQNREKRHGFLKQALSRLAQAARLKHPYRSLLLLSELLFNDLGQYDQGRRVLAEAEATKPGDHADLFWTGIYHALKRELGTTLTLWQQAMDENPAFFWPYLVLGDFFSASAQGRAFIDTGLALRPNLPRMQLLKGKSCLLAGEKDRAERFFQRAATAAGSGGISAHLALAGLHQMLGHTIHAREEAQLALTTSSYLDAVEGGFIAALANICLEDFSGALARIDRAVAVGLGIPRFFFLKGLLHLKLGDHRAALDQAEMAALYDNFDFDIIALYIAALESTGQTDLVAEEYGRSADLFSDEPFITRMEGDPTTYIKKKVDHLLAWIQGRDQGAQMSVEMMGWL
ncbi:MAG: serine/threonine protein kinase [Deltaproteobacteria bacterium]|nr:serine/threonine protein kinase [Deltaproteobacteria bacterium]